MNRTSLLVLLFTVLLAIPFAGLTGCGIRNSNEHKAQFFAMDTYITLTVYGDERAREGLDAAVSRIREIEERMSIYIEGSDVDLINKNAAYRPVKVHDDTFYVIKKGLSYGELTEGAFDITIYPLVRLWDITSENPRVPDEDEIQEALESVDYRRVRLDETEGTVLLEKEGMMIDLGGIAKGYAGDEAVRVLKEYDVEHALVNLGGNILTIGGKPDGTDWHIGLQNPRTEDGGAKHFAILDVRDRSVVTSGDYERYMVDMYKKTGVRYHHIFNPGTGYPANTGLISTTIISKSAIDADALSTSLFIMGREKGLSFIEQLDGIEAICVTEDKRVYSTETVQGKIRVTHPDYRLDGRLP
jgi:thiamine biosynthesis lipoprotein